MYWLISAVFGLFMNTNYVITGVITYEDNLLVCNENNLVGLVLSDIVSIKTNAKRQVNLTSLTMEGDWFNMTRGEPIQLAPDNTFTGTEELLIYGYAGLDRYSKWTWTIEGILTQDEIAYTYIFELGSGSEPDTITPEYTYQIEVVGFRTKIPYEQRR